MKWKPTPKFKIYEAIGAVGDGRIYIEGNIAKVFSSTGNKHYIVEYNPELGAIMTNDNGSYWQGYLGYPAIAYLMKIGVISYKPIFAETLKGLPWKDMNQSVKNDFNKTAEYVHKLIEENGLSVRDFLEEIDSIYNQLNKLNLSLLGEKILPPCGY